MCSSCRDYILLLLLYFKLFSSKNANSRSDINGAYRMKNLSAWRKVHRMHAFKMFVTAVWLLLLLSAIFSVPELGTMSKNSFGETALGIRPLWGVYSSRTHVPPPPPTPSHETADLHWWRPVRHYPLGFLPRLLSGILVRQHHQATTPATEF